MQKAIVALLLSLGLSYGAINDLSVPHDPIDSAAIPKVVYIDQNFDSVLTITNHLVDTVNLYLGSGFTGTVLKSNTGLRLTIDNDANSTAEAFALTRNGATDTLFRCLDLDLSCRLFGATTISGAATLSSTLGVTGVATFTAQPIMSSLTASLPVFTDGSKGLVSNAMTGTGNVMMSASPTTTGTLTGAAANFSGAVSTGALSATTGSFSSTLGVTGVSSLTGNVNINGATNATNHGLHVLNKSISAASGSLYSFGAGDASSTTNSEFVQLRHSGSLGELYVSRTTGGSFRDFVLYTSDTERQRVSAAGAHTLTGTVSISSTLDVTGKVVGQDTIAAEDGLRVGSVAASNVNWNRSAANMWNTPDSVTIAGELNVTDSIIGASQRLTGNLRVGGLSSFRTVITLADGDLSTNTETGSGSHVRATSPTLTTPNIGAATGTSLNVTGNVTADSLISSKFYAEGSFTATATGLTTTPTGGVNWTRVGRVVTLTLPALSGTSNASTFTFTGMPANIRPANTHYSPISWATDNGAAMTAVTASISSSGVIGFNISGFSNVWTSSGTKGLAEPTTIVYSME
jgi:hypothetical protein